MCESFHVRCACGNRSAELFFGKMLLGRTSVARLYCPECSRDPLADDRGRVEDNGWALDLDMGIIRSHATSFAVHGADLTADWVFDNGYVTWVGITPDDAEQRNREREEIQALAATDFKAYLQAMKEWGIGRQRKFAAEGWRKALR